MLGSVLKLISSITYLAGKGTYNICQEIDNKNKLKEKGTYDKCIPIEKHEEIRRKYLRDWTSGKKMYFPKEIQPFLECSVSGLQKFIDGLCMKEEMDNGYRPMYATCGYDKRTFNPFGGFDRVYKEYISNKGS